jgi:hypothetical protein
MSLGGVHLGIWDYLTFLTFFIIGAGCVGVVVFLLGLPGRIAIARSHPDAEAVQLMGYLGFLAVIPWVQAFIWAFKPTDIIDIRRFPPEEKQAIKEQIAQLSGKGVPAKTTEETSVPPAGKDAK